MKRIVLCGLCGALALPAAIPTVTIASDVWPGYFNRDLSGAYVDIVREALRPGGIVVRFQAHPYDQAKELLRQGRVDGLLGPYRDEIRENALYPVWHIDTAETQVLFLRQGHTWVDERTLAGMRVAWEKGFDMDVMLHVPVKRIEVPSVRAGLEALLAGRADFFIDERSQVEEARRVLPGIDWSPFSIVTFHKKKIYLVFAPALRELAAAWDRELLKMVRDGRLKEIFVRWKLMRAEDSIADYFMTGAI